MGRPREFDEDEVLDKATTAFWDRGYEGTSIADLMAATDLAKGSVYKAFGDKRSLFLRTLDRYLKAGNERLNAEMAGGPAPVVIRRWFAYIVAVASRRDSRCGCYAVNASIELAPHDADVRARLRRQRKQQAAILARVLQRGIDEGDFHPDLDVAGASRLLITLIYGLQVAGRQGTSAAELKQTVELGLRPLLGPPS